MICTRALLPIVVLYKEAVSLCYSNTRLVCLQFLLFIMQAEKARLQAEAKAAEAARKCAEAEAAAGAKRQRELEREAARQALLKARVVNSVQCLQYYLFF